MSRLAKNLKPHDACRRVVDGWMPSLSVLEKTSNTDGPVILKEYVVETLLRASCMVDESAALRAREASVWEDAVRSTRRKIIEEVFGEFRPMLYQLNEAAHQRDWAAVNHGLKQMYDTMFEEGL